MDEKDEKILDVLEDDGRASYTEIAEKLDVSEGTVRNRVEKMVEKGIIERFTIERRDQESKAIVMTQLETGKEIENVLSSFPDDIPVLEVAGNYDLILEIQRESNEEINSVLDEVRSIEGVKETETYMVLNERN